MTSLLGVQGPLTDETEFIPDETSLSPATARWGVFSLSLVKQGAAEKGS